MHKRLRKALKTEGFCSLFFAGKWLREAGACQKLDKKKGLCYNHRCNKSVTNCNKLRIKRNKSVILFQQMVDTDGGFYEFKKESD